jgi:thiamine-phosphate pyrophosphorylase
MGFSLPRFYAIIDPSQTGDRSPVEVCEILLGAGVHLIQYRDKLASSRALFENSRDLAEWVRGAGGVFLVNDRADVAWAAGAHGVHVGQDDLPVELARRIVGLQGLVGYSTHDLAQLAEAERASADYVAYGPVFPTRSKANADRVVGLEGLRAARKATHKPLVGIGGITLETANAVLEAGADSVAVISDLLRAPDLAGRAKEFLRALGEVPVRNRR